MQTSDLQVLLTDFCDGRSRAVDDYAAATRRRHAATLRAMCEASRGRQLRLIRAETDSGRSDGLLNTLTCRQPSARLHFLYPSPYVVYDVTELRARRTHRRYHVAKLCRSCVRAKICQLILHISSAATIPFNSRSTRKKMTLCRQH